ncbi:hypothetical protein D3C87_583370 [compost metagenome]
MVNPELQTRLIFLDSNTYISKNFQFGTYELEKLRSYIDSENLHLLITDVNISEVKKHIRRKAVEAAAALRVVAKDAMILRNTPGFPAHGIFDKLDVDTICSEIEGNFERFLDGGNVEIVSVNIANIDDIFSDYFLEKPPFDTVDKKSEFPDAFVLSAISKIAKDRHHKLYVVSNDGDFKRYCAGSEHLISISKIEQLIDLIVRNSEQLAEPAKFADDIYDSMKDDIEREIREVVEGTQFDIDSVDDDADIDEVDIESLEFVEKSIVDVSTEHATYEVKIKMSVIVNTSYIDYERSPYDPEDGAYLYTLTNSIVTRYKTTATVLVNLVYDDGIKENAEIESVNVDGEVNLSELNSEILSYSSGDLRDDDEQFEP